MIETSFIILAVVIVAIALIPPISYLFGKYLLKGIHDAQKESKR